MKGNVAIIIRVSELKGDPSSSGLMSRTVSQFSED